MQVSKVNSDKSSPAFKGITKFVVNAVDLDDFTVNVAAKIRADKAAIVKENPFYYIYEYTYGALKYTPWSMHHFKTLGKEITPPKITDTDSKFAMFLLTGNDFKQYDKKFESSFAAIKEWCIVGKDYLKEALITIFNPNKNAPHMRDSRSLLSVYNRNLQVQSDFDNFLSGKNVKEVIYKPKGFKEV